MKPPFSHPMMPQAEHDECAREHFVVDLKIYMEEDVYPVDAAVYEKKALPQFKKEHGRAPENHHEVRKLMEREPSTQLWSAIARTIQEMLWDGTGNTVERQLPDLISRAKIAEPLGTLTLDPALKAPRYNGEIDIHRMPGNYHTVRAENDASQGALYDRGRFVYNGGAAGPLADGLPRTLAAYIKKRWPDFRPKKILELGCTIGSSTVPVLETAKSR